MHRSIEAAIEADGQVRLLEQVRLSHPCRAIVTILDEGAIPGTALMSEPTLAGDWSRPEEAEAWSHLQMD